MKKINQANYKKDQLYAAVARGVAELLKTTNVIAPVELLLHLQRITKQQHEDWRFGRIPYLERVCVGNLSKLNRLLRILHLHALALGLKPSQTVYHKWGRGGKRIVLRFSKSGEANLEAAYSRHYVAQDRSLEPPSGDDPVQQLTEPQLAKNKPHPAKKQSVPHRPTGVSNGKGTPKSQVSRME